MGLIDTESQMSIIGGNYHLVLEALGFKLEALAAIADGVKQKIIGFVCLPVQCLGMNDKKSV